MDITLEEILKPSQELESGRYYRAESIILLAAAISDFGRDYEILGPESPYGEGQPVKISFAILAALEGSWTPQKEVEERILRIQSELPMLVPCVIDGFGKFTYDEPREDGATVTFGQASYEDLPEEFSGRFAGAHFRTMADTCLKMLTAPGFVGEPKEKVDGLNLRYFDSSFHASRDAYTGRDYSFYLHYFIAPEGELVAWKTGIPSNFQREGLYTVIGGTVKAQDSYPGRPSKTLLTRAKFFDHQTVDRYIERPGTKEESPDE